MPTRYDFITFDCFGTLIDWEAGISAAFLRKAAEGGVTLTREAVLEAYARHEPIVQAEAFRSYREVLGEAALRAAQDLRWFLSPREAGFLADSLPEWPPFPDTVPALKALATAGKKLGLLSNVDNDLLAATRRRHLPVAFDLIVTAEQVGSYKPSRGHFIEARDHIGEQSWLHAAQSYFHDVIPARSLGIPVAWVNRKDELSADGGVPTIETRSLEGLVDALV